MSKPKLKPPTRKELLKLWERVQFLRVNGPWPEEIAMQGEQYERLMGISQTLEYVLGKPKNYTVSNIERWEEQMRELHKEARPGGCRCGVCMV